MVKIRLTRIGKTNSPSYRIVVVDSKKKRDGKSIEIIGFYNPSTNPIEHKLDEVRYNFWVAKGAQPTEAVKQIKEGKYEHIPYDPNATKEEPSEEVTEVEAPAQEETKEEKTDVDVDPKEEIKTEEDKSPEVSKEEKSE